MLNGDEKVGPEEDIQIMGDDRLLVKFPMGEFEDNKQIIFVSVNFRHLLFGGKVFIIKVVEVVIFFQIAQGLVINFINVYPSEIVLRESFDGHGLIMKHITRNI